MREMFKGYYKPSETEFSEIWKSGIFAFDANILLRVYQYTPDTAKAFLDILKKLRKRIWVPNQAALEYHDKRLEVVSRQLKPYEEINKLLDNTIDKLKGYKQHAYIDAEKLVGIYEKSAKTMKGILEKEKSEHPDLIKSDPYLEAFAELFEGKVGIPYTEEKLAGIYKEVDRRFERNIPPGYKDSAKKGIGRYGDVIIWFQLIEYAKEVKKPLIFITEDKKEDWWLFHNDNLIGPRPELIQEMLAKAGVFFYMYQSDMFLKHVGEFLKIRSTKDTIDEIRDVRKKTEDAERLEVIVPASQYAYFPGLTGSYVGGLKLDPSVYAIGPNGSYVGGLKLDPSVYAIGPTGPYVGGLKLDPSVYAVGPTGPYVDSINLDLSIKPTVEPISDSHEEVEDEGETSK